MKKNKLLLATAILTTALGTASLNQNVKAETAGVVSSGQLTIKKSITNFNDDTLLMPKATFTFDVKPVDVTGEEKDTASGLKIQKGIAGVASQTIQYDNTDKPTNKEKAVNFDFSTVTFPNVGVYRYEVSEQAGDVKGITYDSKKWTVDVYVVNENNKFTPKYIVSKETTDSSKKPIVFNNELKTTSLTIKKEVTGNSGDKTSDFTFTLLLKENTQFETGQKVKATKKKSGAEEETVEVTIGKQYTFTLKDSEELILDKLPIGITYQVDETDKNKEQYETSAKMTEDSKEAQDYTLNDLKTTDETADTITVTNKRNLPIPTGVVGTLAPFAVLSIVAIGGVIYITKRKKA
ncbi:TPA: QVPTGV class sortase B protein-sorting domain-containing protein [Streptococcus pyogenes]|nr:QVPTGV class sortase B protein-sorting domain-containing protein [Streptococcus pyogenes]